VEFRLHSPYAWNFVDLSAAEYMLLNSQLCRTMSVADLQATPQDGHDITALNQETESKLQFCLWFCMGMKLGL
jgi:hypothetical protein